MYYNESSRILQYAVDEANEKILQDTEMRIAVEIDTIAIGQEYMMSRKVCNLLEVNSLYSSSKMLKSNYYFLRRSVSYVSLALVL